jgi:hypothetical protein
MKVGKLLRVVALNFVRIAGLTIALGCLGTISLGGWQLFKGLLALVQHGAFEGEPFWKFARLEPGQSMLLNVDKAWWFILVGTAGFILNMALVGRIIRFLSKELTAHQLMWQLRSGL